MKFSANLGFLWAELALPEAIHAAKAARFGAVECHWPYDTSPEEVARALAGMLSSGLLDLLREYWREARPEARALSRAKLEIADIFRRYSPAWRRANEARVGLSQLKVMSAIEACRTEALGGRVAACTKCSHQHTAGRVSLSALLKLPTLIQRPWVFCLTSRSKAGLCPPHAFLGQTQ